MSTSVSVRRTVTSSGRAGTLRWAVGLAVADRRNVGRLLVMAVGVGLCTFVLLALTTISPLINSVSTRNAAATPQYADAGSFAALSTSVTVDQQRVSGMMLQANTPAAPTPPGTTRFPADGELVVSPALATLLRDPAQQTLRALFPGPVVGTIDPGVLSGPHDLYFYEGTDTLDGSSDTYGAGNTAAGWGVAAGDHPIDPRLWTLLITGAAVVMVPLLLFTALAGRIGAARRDRRSALLRLLGASVSRLRWLVAGEALLASALGALLAAVGYLGCRLLAPLVQLNGQGLQVADVSPGPWATPAVLIGVPALAIAAALIGSRQAAIGPLGVLSRTSRAPRLGWRAVLVAATVGVGVWARWLQSRNGTDGSSLTDTVLLCLVVALTLFSVAALVGVCTDRLARHGVDRGVPGLLARQRIVQDGAITTRAAAASATVLAGFITLMTLLANSGTVTAQDRVVPVGTYFGTFQNLSGAEWDRLDRSLHSVPGVRSASLTADLGNSVDGPSVSVATCDAVRPFTGGQNCRDGDTYRITNPVGDPLPTPPFLLQSNDGKDRTWSPPADVRTLRWPAPDSAGVSEVSVQQVISADYVLTPAAARQQFPEVFAQPNYVEVQLQVPRTATAAVQRAVAWLGWRGYGALSFSTFGEPTSSPVPWVRAGLIGSGVLTLLICALGQWLMGAEQLSERRRAFALARASGVPLSVLGRSVIHSALLPVAVGVGLAVPAGAALAQVVQYLRGSDPVPLDWAWIGTGAGATIVVALLVATLSAARLGRITGPGALRTE